MEKFAIIYDFDYTLSTKNSFEFSLFPSYGIKSDYEFLSDIEAMRKECNFEMILSFLYGLVQMAKQHNRPITKEILFNAGKDIEFYPGVIEYFDKINEIGRHNGFEIEHYLLSSGLTEIMQGSKIASKFRKIFGSEFHYDENGLVDWPLNSINYTNKTQFIYRINKGILNNTDDKKLNAFMPKKKRAIKYRNMIYIGDGLTDVPCMKTMIDRNGYAIAVFSEDPKNAKSLLDHRRCNAIAKADYREGSQLFNLIKKRVENCVKK